MLSEDDKRYPSQLLILRPLEDSYDEYIKLITGYDIYRCMMKKKHHAYDLINMI